MKLTRPTPRPHISPDPLEVETPQPAYPPVQTATSMEVGGRVGDICLEPMEDLGVDGVGSTELTPLERYQAEVASLRALCGDLERQLHGLLALLSSNPPVAQEASLRGELGLVVQQLHQCLALLARLPHF